MLGNIIKAWFSKIPDDLRKRRLLFTIFVVFCFALAIFNGWLSFHFWEALFDSSPNAETLATVTTYSIAILAFVLISHVVGEVVGMMTGEFPGSAMRPMLVVSILTLFLVVGSDIVINLYSRRPLSETLTQGVKVNNSQTINSQYDQQIAAIQAQMNSILARYTWKGKVYFAKTKWHPEFPKDRKRMDELERQLQEKRDLQTRAATIELTDYTSDQVRFADQVKQKVSRFKYIILVSYGLMILLTFFVASFIRQLAKIEPQKEETPAPTQSGNQEAKEETKKRKKRKRKEEAQRAPIAAKTGNGLYTGNGMGFHQNRKDSLEKVPVSEAKTGKRGSKKRKRKSGKNYSTRVDNQETFHKVVSTWKALKQETGRKPKYAEISSLINVSIRTVGAHVRQARAMDII